MRESYRAMFESSPQPMYVLDLATLEFLAVNDAAVAHYGYTREELGKMTAADLWPPEDASRNRELAARPLPLRHVVMRHRKKDGSVCRVEVRVNALTFDGRASRLVLVNDVTERVAADDNLREARASEATFRGFVEAAPDAVVIADRLGKIVLVNSQTERLYGYTRDELVGQPTEILTAERFRGQFPERLARYLADLRVGTGGSGSVEIYGRRKDGTEFPIEFTVGLIETAGGTLVCGSIRDTTERRKAEEQRFELAALVESSDDAIIGKTFEGIVTSWNGGAQRLFGYSAEEMIGRSICVLIPGDRMQEEPAILEHLAHGEVERFETVRLRKDGHEIHVSVTSSPVRDSSGRLIGASKVVRDITARRRGEAALARAKDAVDAANGELEAFSYSVAHDLRAPLRGMNGFARLLLENYSGKLDVEGRDWLQEITLNAGRMAALIDELLALAKVTRSEPRREEVDLSSVARAVAQELSLAEPRRVVDLLVEDGLTADVDPALARALLENLLGNAWKFTSKATGARIELGAKETDGERVFFVRDNGAGFDMAFAGKLFAPFQRLHTATEFPGTGIGLATVQRIVHRHGGRIWAEGVVDGGATISFTIPSRGPGSTS
jgi:PAS domain S-box-containing protein